MQEACPGQDTSRTCGMVCWEGLSKGLGIRTSTLSLGTLSGPAFMMAAVRALSLSLPQCSSCRRTRDLKQSRVNCLRSSVERPCLNSSGSSAPLFAQ